MSADQAAANYSAMHVPSIGEPLGDFGFDDVLEMIPHRYPMLMIDGIKNVVAFKHGTGIKNVTFNEPFFQGHFPGDPIMPGVLMIEALAQSAGALVVASLGPEARGSLVYFMSIERSKFRRPVRPGDQLKLDVTLIQSKLSVYKFEGKASVDGKLATEATFSAKVMTGIASRNAANKVVQAL